MLIAGEQHERAPARRLEYQFDLGAGPRGELLAARVWKMLRNVEQNLFSIIEEAVDGQRSCVVQAQARLRVRKIVVHGQSRRCENHGSDVRLSSRTFKDSETSIGVACR